MKNKSSLSSSSISPQSANLSTLASPTQASIYLCTTVLDHILHTLYYKHVTAKSIGDFELFKSGQFIAKNVFKLTSIFPLSKR